MNETRNEIEQESKADETKEKPLKQLARELAEYRVQEEFYKNLIELHAKLIELAFIFNMHPDNVFKVLMEYDESLKK